MNRWILSLVMGIVLAVTGFVRSSHLIAAPANPVEDDGGGNDSYGENESPDEYPDDGNSSGEDDSQYEDEDYDSDQDDGYGEYGPEER